MLGLEPDRVMAAFAAAPGALIYGVFHLATLWLTGQPARREDYARAAVNIGAAICVGMITAYFVAPAVKASIPMEALRDIHLVGFVTGAFCWELLPVIYKLAKGRLTKAGGGE